MVKEEIKEQAIYTAEETQDQLKISRSTFMRLVKKGVLRANKIGGQYRILGRELLRLVLPVEEFERLKGFIERESEIGVKNEP